MNTGQRTILWLGVFGLFLVWLLPPSYHIHSDGIRLETSWHWVWSLPHEWSINTSLIAWRIITIVLITAAAYFGASSSKTEGGAK